jgi:hypothetical protein
MIKFYYYKHPISGEIFSDQRFEESKDVPYKSADGEICERIEKPLKLDESDSQVNILIINKNGEVFERFPEEVRAANPKYIEFRDGHKERYDPSRHF